MREAKKLPATITISRPRGNGPEVASIKIEDAGSGIQVVEVDIPLKDFAEAVLGQGHVRCKAEWRGLHLVGCKREHEWRTVIVPGKGWTRDNKAGKAAVAALESDGWKGRVSDTENSHRREPKSDTADGTAYSVLFERYVRPDGSAVL